jgi:hypothetical protein
MLLIGFLLHPDFFSFKIVTTAEKLANNLRGGTMFHVAHLILKLAILFILAALLWSVEKLQGMPVGIGVLRARLASGHAPPQMQPV